MLICNISGRSLSRKTQNSPSVADRGLFLAVVALFVFHLARHGGEAPGGASFGVKGAAGFLAQLLAGDEFGHGGHFLSTNRI